MYSLHSLLAFGIALLFPFHPSQHVAADFGPFLQSEEYMAGVWGAHPKQRYLSNPFAIGPVANRMIEPASKGRSPSKYILYAPFGPTQPTNSPSIIDADTLHMVWFGPNYGKHAIGPLIQSCNDQSYIVFWSGLQENDRPVGRNYMLDTKYNLIYNISTQGRLDHADSHEIVLTPECTAIQSVFQTRPYNFGPFGPEDSWLKDSYFQEMDLATGELLFEWQASDHINLTETYWTHPGNGIPEPTNGFDWFHLNSVAKDKRGNYMVNSRHTHAVYYVSGKDGSVIWTLGGKNNDFADLSDGRATDFKWQHFARWVDVDDPTTITIYDNNNAEHHESPPGSVSRGIVLKLDFEAMTVRLERAYYATNGINSLREGSVQVIPDTPEPGNVLMGYGGDPGWSEFAPDGTVLDDVMWGPIGVNRASADNYRAIKSNWTGRPHYPARIAPGPRPGYRFDPENQMFEIMLLDEFGGARPNDTAYFSWNGATEVTSWVVLASNDTDKLDVTSHFWAQVPKIGFETNCEVFPGTRWVLALAVDAQDNVLGSTNTMDMQAYLDNGGGPHTARSHDTDDLTAAWKQYVAAHPPASDILGALRDHWRENVGGTVAAHPHASIAVGSGFVLFLFGIVAVLVLSKRGCCGTCRIRRWSPARGRYMRGNGGGGGGGGIPLARGEESWMKEYSDGEEDDDDVSMEGKRLYRREEREDSLVGSETA